MRPPSARRYPRSASSAIPAPSGDSRGWLLTRVLEARASEHPDAPFLLDLEGQTLSYGETALSVRRLATSLAERGVRAGDQIATALPNSSAAILLWLAFARLGAVEHALNIEWKGSVVDHVLELARPRIIVTSPDSMLGPASGQVVPSCVDTVLVLDETAREEQDLGLHLHSTRLTLAQLMGDSDRPPKVAIGPETPSVVVYSSGLGGRTKGCVCPNGQAYVMAHNHAVCLDLSRDDVCHTSLPLFHSHARLIQAGSILLVGGTLVLSQRFSKSSWLRNVCAYGATTTTLLGPMLEFVLGELPDPAPHNLKLRTVVVAPVPSDETRDRFERLTEAKLLGVYGTTAMGNFCYNTIRARKARSAGRILPWYQIRLEGADGTPAAGADGSLEGELLVRAMLPHTTALHLLSADSETSLTDRDGWHRTGDEVALDQDGYVFFRGRVTDYIRRRGENISVVEVEEAVLSHDGISEVACIGIPSSYAGGEDDVKLCVVRKDGHGPTAADIFAFAGDVLPRFAAPRFIHLLDALPRTKEGAIDRVALRDAHAATPGTERESGRAAELGRPSATDQVGTTHGSLAATNIPPVG